MDEQHKKIEKNPYWNEFKEMITGDRSVGIFPFEISEARNELIKEAYEQNKEDIHKFAEDIKEILECYDYANLIEIHEAIYETKMETQMEMEKR